MSSDPATALLRVYFDPSEIGPDGYPWEWHRPTIAPITGWESVENPLVSNLMRSIGGEQIAPAIKDLIRERDGNRCLRCKHPYTKGEHPLEYDEEEERWVSWSPCDEQCDHPKGPYRWWDPIDGKWFEGHASHKRSHAGEQAAWRVLTVHHLNGVKHDCRWWNLVSLCQRCHLTIQGKVYMERPWNTPHSEWFKPFVAGFYAWKYLDEELTPEQVIERLEELLALELTQEALW